MSRKPYILTHSGQLVSADSGCPTIADIALALSRAPRFAGHTRVPYSVLDHSLFAFAMAQQEKPKALPLLLAVLLHDAHEAVTADNPSPFKDEHLRTIQQALDERIGETHGGVSTLFTMFSEAIKTYDRRALLAEAYVVGPPSLVSMEDVATHFGDIPERKDIEQLQHFVKVGAAVEPKLRVFATIAEKLKRG